MVKGFFIKYILPKHKFEVEDMIKSSMGDEKYKVEAKYYDEKLNPVLIVKDKQGKLFSIPQTGVTKN